MSQHDSSSTINHNDTSPQHRKTNYTKEDYDESDEHHHSSSDRDVEKALPGEKDEAFQEREAREKDAKDQKDPNCVEWEKDDPEFPQNWSFNFRVWVVAATSIQTFVVTYASSTVSSGVVPIAEEFGVSEETSTLATSLFVLGYVFGPILWGPFSEVFGRKLPLQLGFWIFVIFNIPCAVATNIQTLMICRFFGGFFACAPLTIVGGMLADIWNPVQRGVAICAFAGATFLGPVFGPIIGGFVVDSYLGWRWTIWLILIAGAAAGVLGTLTVPETFAPLLLSRRAKKIRFRTKNWAIHAPLDEREISGRDIAVKYLARPFAMLVLEPILLLISIYLAMVYGCLYLFFTAYPISFTEQRGWNDGVGALPFLAITIGVVVGSGIIIAFTLTRFKRKLKETGKVVPEERLPPMMIGAFMFTIGLFWFAWTSFPSITWVPQVLAGIPIGAGVLIIFMQGLNYLIDVYLMNANSAIAANSILRSLAGAGFPLFALPMYNNLGVQWATSILAFISLVMIPIPFLFFYYGERIRKWSKYTMSM